ncbi:MAG: cytochrome c oxidase assembly protein [Acidimicrobiales bacterium]
MLNSPSWPGVLARWSVEPAVVVLLALAVALYVRGAQIERPGARHRVLFGAGLVAVALALLSPVDTYAEVLLSVHMVQHLLLVIVAAPLLAGSRCTSVLLAALPRRLAVPIEALGRSWVARVVTHPLVSWTLFAATGWVVHFSPLFDAALREPVAHAAEHVLLLGTALLFWRPVVGREPLSYPLRLVYLALAMPQNTFLALAIYSAGHPLYDTYVRQARAWGPSVLDDQRLGGGLMWVAGDLTLLVAVLAVAAAWGSASMAGEDVFIDEG